MSVTPANKFMLPLENARNLLANCAAFQTLCNTVGNVTNTKAKIWFFVTDDEHEATQAALPRAIVSYRMADFAATRVSTSGFTTTGPIVIRVEAATTQSTMQDGLTEFGNSFGLILQEMESLVIGPGSYLNVTKIVVLDFGPFDQPENNGLRGHGCEFAIEWQGDNL